MTHLLRRWLQRWQHRTWCHGEPPACPQCHRDGIDVFLRRDWFSDGRNGAYQEHGRLVTWWSAQHTCGACQRRITIRVER